MCRRKSPFSHDGSSPLSVTPLLRAESQDSELQLLKLHFPEDTEAVTGSDCELTGSAHSSMFKVPGISEMSSPTPCSALRSRFPELHFPWGRAAQTENDTGLDRKCQFRHFVSGTTFPKVAERPRQKMMRASTGSASSAMFVLPHFLRSGFSAL